MSGIVRVSYINSHERQAIVSLLPAGAFLGLTRLFRKPITLSAAKRLMAVPSGRLNRRLSSKYFWPRLTIIFAAGTPRPFIREGMLTFTASKALGCICAGALRSSCLI